MIQVGRSRRSLLETVQHSRRPRFDHSLTTIDHSQSQTTVNFQSKEDQVPEDHVTHWQEQQIMIFELRQFILERKKQERMRRREQALMALKMCEDTWEQQLSGIENKEEQDQNYHQSLGPDYWESVD